MFRAVSFLTLFFGYPTSTLVENFPYDSASSGRLSVLHKLRLPCWLLPSFIWKAVMALRVGDGYFWLKVSSPFSLASLRFSWCLHLRYKPKPGSDPMDGLLTVSWRLSSIVFCVMILAKVCYQVKYSWDVANSCQVICTIAKQSRRAAFGMRWRIMTFGQ